MTKIVDVKGNPITASKEEAPKLNESLEKRRKAIFHRKVQDAATVFLEKAVEASTASECDEWLINAQRVTGIAENLKHLYPE